MSWKKTLILVVAAVLVNILLAELNMFFKLPLFLDSIATAVIAALFGPAVGVAVALLTQAGFELIHGFNGMFAPWVVCSIATALIVGFAARRGYFHTPFQAIVIGFLVALANALLGAIVHISVYNSFSGHAVDMLVQGFELLIGSRFWAALWARIPMNLLDKGLAVLIAYIFSRRLFREP